MAKPVYKLPELTPYPDKDFEENWGDGAIYKKLKRAPNGEAILDEAFISCFEKLLTEGNTRNNASRICGVTRNTVAKWLKQGFQDIEAHVESIEAKFTWMVDRCEGGQERRLVQAAFKAALSPASDGTLALKILERRIPEAWAPALPDNGDPAAAYAGATKRALIDESKRVIAQMAQSTEMTGEVVEKK